MTRFFFMGLPDRALTIARDIRSQRSAGTDMRSLGYLLEGCAHLHNRDPRAALVSLREGRTLVKPGSVYWTNFTLIITRTLLEMDAYDATVTEGELLLKHAERDPQFAVICATTMRIMASALIDSAPTESSYDLAEQWLRTALRDHRNAVPLPILEVARDQAALAEVIHQFGGDYVEAANLGRKAVETITTTLGPKHPDLIYCHHTLGNLLRLVKNDDEALISYKTAAAICSEHYGESIGLMRRLFSMQAAIAVSQGRDRDCVTLSERALLITQGSPEKVKEDQCYLHTQAGLALSNLGSYPQAEKHLRAAISLSRSVATTGETLTPKLVLATVLERQEKIAEAKAVLDECVASARKKKPVDNQLLLEALIARGRAHIFRKEGKQGIDDIIEAAGIEDNLDLTALRPTADARLPLAKLLMKAGKHSDAEFQARHTLASLGEASRRTGILTPTLDDAYDDYIEILSTILPTMPQKDIEARADNIRDGLPLKPLSLPK